MLSSYLSVATERFSHKSPVPVALIRPCRHFHACAPSARAPAFLALARGRGRVSFSLSPFYIFFRSFFSLSSCSALLLATSHDTEKTHVTLRYETRCIFTRNQMSQPMDFHEQPSIIFQPSFVPHQRRPSWVDLSSPLTVATGRQDGVHCMQHTPKHFCRRHNSPSVRARHPSPPPTAAAASGETVAPSGYALGSFTDSADAMCSAWAALLPALLSDSGGRARSRGL